MRLLARLALALLVATLTLLAGEGLHVRLTGESLVARLRPRGFADLPVHEVGDAEKTLRGARSAGAFRADEDPAVGFTFKRELDVSWAGRRFRTDEQGLAEEPPALDCALRLVLAGGEQAFASAEARADSPAGIFMSVLNGLGGPQDKPIAVHTVAVPGWTLGNAVRYLLDRLFVADLVVLLVESDGLADGWGVDQDGFLVPRPEPGSPAPLATFRPPGAFEARVDRPADWRWDGPDPRWSFGLGLGHSGRARLAREVAALATLARRLERRGARLVLASLDGNDLPRILRGELARQGLDVPEVTLVAEEDGRWVPEEGLVERCAALARMLVTLRLVPRTTAPNPFSRVNVGSLETVDDQAEALRVAAEAALVARIEPAAELGLAQAQGGLFGDGRIAPEALFLLPRGRELVGELEAVVVSPGLYPLDFALLVEGEPLGTLTLSAPGARAAFTLDVARFAGPVELHLRAADWGLAELLGRREPIAARLVFVESRP